MVIKPTDWEKVLKAGLTPGSEVAPKYEKAKMAADNFAGCAPACR
ncbi:MAG: hypothetical protein RML56_06555 [Burkholderiales bacterium]|nr:hypothetical protein [Burkholderiales bacterium]